MRDEETYLGRFVVSLDTASKELIQKLLDRLCWASELVKNNSELLVENTAQGQELMSTLDDDIAAIAAQTTAIGSLTTFIQGLEDQIKALPGLTPAQQAQIDKVFVDVTANTDAINAAMKANVPPVV